MKYMFICYLLSILFSVSITGTENKNDVSSKDMALTGYLVNLYRKEPVDSPARYALNQITTTKSWIAFRVLKKDFPSTPQMREQSRIRLEQIKKDIERGLNWPIKTPPDFSIPYVRTKPVIDGRLDETAWRNALTFKGQYLLNELKNENNGTVWKIMWDKNNLYIGIYFPDESLVAVDYIPGKSGPWQGDSLEVFIMPSKRIKTYWEVVTGCNGSVFDGLHVNNKWGTFIGGPRDNIIDLKSKAYCTNKGYSVEMSIPFREMPNYMLGNPPAVGEIIYFAMVRTAKDRKNEKLKLYSAFPLLYDGHNIFGYAKGTLSPNKHFHQYKQQIFPRKATFKH